MVYDHNGSMLGMYVSHMAIIRKVLCRSSNCNGSGIDSGRGSGSDNGGGSGAVG